MRAGIPVVGEVMPAGARTALRPRLEIASRSLIATRLGLEIPHRSLVAATARRAGVGSEPVPGSAARASLSIAARLLNRTVLEIPRWSLIAACVATGLLDPTVLEIALALHASVPVCVAAEAMPAGASLTADLSIASRCNAGTRSCVPEAALAVHGPIGASIC